MMNGYSDGNWGAWSAREGCTVSCGGGVQFHTRLCNNPTPSNGGDTCSGPASAYIPCNTFECFIGKEKKKT